MGTVELAIARGPDGKGRAVALKRLLPEASPRHVEMFLREARVAVLLEHPNVVRAYEFGESAGHPFIAMEYVDGEPLSRVLAALRDRGRTLDRELSLHVLGATLEGLHAAHELRDERGVLLHLVHRDVSPHNVMIGHDGTVKLLDFGVAKIEADDRLTRTGEVKGKVAYMSPEQAMGDPVDRRSDLYSVGAVLFECLTGRRMWEGTDLEVMRKLALSDPPRLEADAPGVGAELAAVFDRLVAKDRESRLASALTVAGELRRLAGRPGEALESALAAMMSTLFEGDGTSRRAELDRALEATGEANLEEVRKTLFPSRSSIIGRTSPPPRSPPESPSFVRASGGKARVVLVGISLAVALVSAVAYATRRSEQATPSAPASPEPASSASPEPASSKASPEPASPEPASPASAEMKAPPVRAPSSTAPRPSRPRPSAPPSSAAPQPPRPLDVDPNAI